MKTFSFSLLTVALCAVLVRPIDVFAGEGEVTVRLPAVMSHADSMVRAFIFIPRDADNRMLRVTLDSGEFYRSSDVPLEGDHAPQSHTLVWHKLPPGTYDVTVQLVGTMRIRQVVRRQLHVVGIE